MMMNAYDIADTSLAMLAARNYVTSRREVILCSTWVSVNIPISIGWTQLGTLIAVLKLFVK